MVRKNYFNKYEEEVRVGLQELFEACRRNMAHPGDLLLCQQNGFIFRGNPCIGLGDDGLNNIGSINMISLNGIADITNDENYFTTNGNSFFQGSSALEHSIKNEKNSYLNMWENTFFLRVFTQIANVLNGCDYDWDLETHKLRFSDKSAHIRKQIVQRLNKAPLFQGVVKYAYVGQIRNAIAHNQYHCIQGGVYYDNFESDQYSTIQATSFDDWEKRYVYSYIIFIGLFQVLTQIKDELYIPACKRTLSGGIPVKLPAQNGIATDSFIFPNAQGDVWRFAKS